MCLAVVEYHEKGKRSREQSNELCRLIEDGDIFKPAFL
jgi:hypothetical protein